MSETYIPFDAIRDSALSAQSELDRSEQMVESLGADLGTESLLRDASLLMAELTNPGSINRLASGFAAGMMESPYAQNRQIGASMAASLGADDAAIKQKIGVVGQLEQTALAFLDRKRKQWELKQLPEETRLRQEQQKANIEATKKGIELTGVRTEGERISNLISKSDLWTREEKNKYLTDSLKMDQDIDRAKLRVAQSEATLREKEVEHSPDLWRWQQEDHDARMALLKAQEQANLEHGRLYSAQAAKEGVQISQLKNQLPPEIFKWIQSDYEYSTKQMGELVQSQNTLIKQKNDILARKKEIVDDAKMTEAAKKVSLSRINEQLYRIDRDMEATDAMKIQIWNNREMARNTVLAPYFGKSGYSSYGTNKYRPAPKGGSGFPEGGIYQPPPGIPAMIQEGSGAIAPVVDDDPMGLYNNAE